MNSDNIGPTVLKQGILMAIDRDGAKSLFGARGDNALRDFLIERVADEAIWKEKSAISFQGHWRAIAACLNQIDGNAQLDQCILGGRPMYHGAEMTVTLVRPDLVPHLADGLAVVADNAFSAQLPASQDREAVWATFLQMKQLFQSAAEDRHAIVFAVEY